LAGPPCNEVIDAGPGVDRFAKLGTATEPVDEVHISEPDPLEGPTGVPSGKLQQARPEGQDGRVVTSIVVDLDSLAECSLMLRESRDEGCRPEAVSREPQCVQVVRQGLGVEV